MFRLMFRHLSKLENSNTFNSMLNTKKVELSNVAETKDIVNSDVSHAADRVVENSDMHVTIKPIPTFASANPTFEEIYLLAPDVINYILDNYKTEDPNTIEDLLLSITGYYDDERNDKDLRSFSFKRLLNCGLLTVILELWEFYWTEDFFDQLLNNSTPVAMGWLQFITKLIRLAMLVSNANADSAKAIVQIGLFRKLLMSLESDKLDMKRCLMEIDIFDNDKENRNWRVMGNVVSGIIRTVYNCLHWNDCLYEAIPIFCANQGMSKMQLVQEVSVGKGKNFEDLHVRSLLCMAFTQEENEQLDETSLSFLTNFLCKAACEAAKESNRTNPTDKWNLSECVLAMNVLMNSDRCKEELCQNAMLFDCIVEGITTSKDETELLALVRCLYLLAFIEKGKQMINDRKGLMEGAALFKSGDELEVLKTHKNKKIKQNAEGTVWNVSGKRPADFRSNSASNLNLETQAKQQHIMISYDWKHQRIAAAINLQLKAMGYYTWMDIDRMTGSTLESMAEAVEQAAVVIICFSKRYKNSPNCRKEASYADDLKKPIIPVMTKPNYKPDGWLGMMLAKLMYYTCTSVDLVPSVVLNIAKELGDRGKLGQSSQMAVANFVSNERSTEDQLAEMSCEELKLQLERVQWNVPIDNLNGTEFIWLFQLHKRSTKDFLEFLQSMGMTDARVQLRLASYMMDINKLLDKP